MRTNIRTLARRAICALVGHRTSTTQHNLMDGSSKRRCSRCKRKEWVRPKLVRMEAGSVERGQPIHE